MYGLEGFTLIAKEFYTLEVNSVASLKLIQAIYQTQSFWKQAGLYEQIRETFC